MDEGKIPNMYQCIVCDPDGKQGEVRNTGLLYTAVSRATTLGDHTGKGSAIYFTGTDLTHDRIKYVTRTPNEGSELVNVKRRRAWVQSLDECTVQLKVQPHEEEDYSQVMSWAETASFTIHELSARIDKYKMDKQRTYARMRFSHL